jgi:hypothetical protein
MGLLVASVGMEVLLFSVCTLVSPASASTASAPARLPAMMRVPSRGLSCAATLDRLCRSSSSSSGTSTTTQQCDACAGAHQAQLRRAGCSNAQVQAWCAQLERGCGTVPLSCAPNCASAIQHALTACSASGGGSVKLSAGVYHLNDSSWVASGQPMIILKDLRNVALVGHPGSGRYDTRDPDGAATTLLIYGLRGAFALSNCTAIKIRGVQVDMDRQPYTYGRCIAADEGSFTIQFDPEAYPFTNPVPDYLRRVQAVMGFDPVEWRMAHNAVDIYTTSKPYPVSLDSASNRLKIHGGGTGARIK